MRGEGCTQVFHERKEGDLPRPGVKFWWRGSLSLRVWTSLSPQLCRHRIWLANYPVTASRLTKKVEAFFRKDLT